MAKKYFIANGKNHLGPFSLEELQEKSLSPDTLIWCEDFTQWTKANEISELKNFVIPVPPLTPSKVEYQKVKERLYQNFNRLIHNVLKVGKQTIISFLILFISIFIGLVSTANFGDGYSGKSILPTTKSIFDEKIISDLNLYNQIKREQEQREKNERELMQDFRMFPLAEPYCTFGVFVDNNEIWIFLIQDSLFWASMFSIIYLIVYFLLGKRIQKEYYD